MEAEAAGVLGASISAGIAAAIGVLVKLRRNGNGHKPKQEPAPTKSEFAELKSDVKHLGKDVARVDGKVDKLDEKFDKLSEKLSREFDHTPVRERPAG